MYYTIIEYNYTQKNNCEISIYLNIKISNNRHDYY